MISIIVLLYSFLLIAFYAQALLSDQGAVIDRIVNYKRSITDQTKIPRVVSNYSFFCAEKRLTNMEKMVNYAFGFGVIISTALLGYDIWSSYNVFITTVDNSSITFSDFLTSIESIDANLTHALLLSCILVKFYLIKGEVNEFAVWLDQE